MVRRTKADKAMKRMKSCIRNKVTRQRAWIWMLRNRMDWEREGIKTWRAKVEWGQTAHGTTGVWGRDLGRANRWLSPSGQESLEFLGLCPVFNYRR